MQAAQIADRHFMVRVDKGEEVFSSLLAFAEKNDVHSASVTGIGGVKNVRLAYFDTETKEYVPRDFNEENMELVSLVGNLGLLDGEPYLHAHALVSDHSFQCYAGHMISAEVEVTGEFSVRVGDEAILRVENESLGIKEQQFECA